MFSFAFPSRITQPVIQPWTIPFSHTTSCWDLIMKAAYLWVCDYFFSKSVQKDCSTSILILSFVLWSFSLMSCCVFNKIWKVFIRDAKGVVVALVTWHINVWVRWIFHVCQIVVMLLFVCVCVHVSASSCMSETFFSCPFLLCLKSYKLWTHQTSMAVCKLRTIIKCPYVIKHFLLCDSFSYSSEQVKQMNGQMKLSCSNTRRPKDSHHHTNMYYWNIPLQI